MSARGHSDEISAVMHGDFMAFVTDDETFDAVRKWAERQGYPSATVQIGGPDMFAQMLETAVPPKLSIIDIDGQSDPVGVAARLVTLCGEDHKIIVVGSANDVSLYRRFMGTGIADYLVKPLTSETLSQTTATAMRSGANTNEAKEAKTVVVVGVRGGIGASTIAVNISWLLAHDMKMNCALLDLDMQFGTSSLSLDLEPGRGLRDIVSSPQRVDSLMIASSMASESDQFSVRGAEEAVDEHVEIDSGAIAALLKEIKTNFDYVVVDLPRHLFASQKRLLASAQEIILVTELSLVGIRDTLRLRTALGALGFGGHLHIVASRAGPSNTGHISQSAFEKGAQLKIDFVIPEDHKGMLESANTGKAIVAVARQSPATRAMYDLARKIHGKSVAPKAESGGLWGRISGSLPKKPTPKKGA